MIDSIIFDLDGTLWNTLESTYFCANEVAKRNNLNFEITREQVRSGMGKSFKECAEIYMPNIPEFKREKLLKEMIEENTNYLRQNGGGVYPNINHTLDVLKDSYKLFIVSNCLDGYIDAFLDTANLRYCITDYVAASSLKISKGEATKRLIKKYNLKKPIYVGDTLKDLQAAQEAKILFVHAKYGFEPNLIVKNSINNISELLNVIKEISTN